MLLPPPLVRETPCTIELACIRCKTVTRIHIEITVASPLSELDLHKLKYPDNMAYVVGKDGKRVYAKVARPGNKGAGEDTGSDGNA
jgi:hypothetical protein